jgi:phosphopantetheine adenylyltransferase
METQNKEIKFVEKELEEIKEFQQRYVNVQMGFGQAEITRSRLEKQLENVDVFVEELRTTLVTIQEEEREFIENINKKYGDGVLNPETGVFTPNTVDSAEGATA